MGFLSGRFLSRRRRGSVSVLLAVVIVGCGSSVSASAFVRSGVKSLARAGVKPLHPPLRFYDLQSKTLTVRTSASTGVISPSPVVYLVFWGSRWSNDPSRAAPELENFFVGLHGASDTYNPILAQYCEGVPAGTARCGARGAHVVVPTNSVLAGTWFDHGVAPKRAKKAQLLAEAERAARHFGNTTQGSNLNAEYWIASPSGTHPDGFPDSEFCGWHSSGHTKYGQLAFVNLPYIPDLGIGQCTTL